MKYQVGDLLLVTFCEFMPCPRPGLFPRLYNHYDLFNSFGMITQAIKHSDLWEGESTSHNNVYIWFSQLDGAEYYFCENEVTGEVIK